MTKVKTYDKITFANATMAQMVEHILGKDEVIGSIPISSSKKTSNSKGLLVFYLCPRVNIIESVANTSLSALGHTQTMLQQVANEVVLCTNDEMLRVNDVTLCANGILYRKKSLF